MPKQKPNNSNNPGQGEKEGYIIVSNYFLREWVKVLGIGPALLYLELLSYCYKGKDIAWPTLATLSEKMKLTPKTITSYHQILTQYGLIKKIGKRKTSSGSYRRNIYQITPLDKVKNSLPLGNFSPSVEGKNTLKIGKNLPIKHNNRNNTNTTTTKAVVVVDFKKLKEEGEEKIPAIKERLENLDLKEEFIEQLLKDYPPGKIEEKLDLLLNQRNIQSPVGWLVAALKKDYQNPQSSWSFPQEQESTESHDQESVNQDRETMHRDLTTSRRINPPPTKNLNTPNFASREKALKAIRLIRNNLSLPVYPTFPPGREPK
jgi:hypothetical protein